MGKRIEWKGGECPVSADTNVKVWLRDGYISDYPQVAISLYWDRKGESGDIIAYEVIEEAKEEPKQIMDSEKTIRDEFAIAWLQTIDVSMKVDDMADECYKVADAMMKARAK